MNKKISLALIALFSLAVVLHSCKKDDDGNPILEPITISQPDSLAANLFPGDSLPIEIIFTTDRPIDWAKCMYDLDTTGLPGYVASFADTLFNSELDTLDPRINIYTWTGVYIVPDTMQEDDVIRFKASFEGTSPYNATDKTFYTKEFKINVR